MNNLRTILLSILVICTYTINSNTLSAQTDSPASLVNPFIGTGGHGHTFPGATAPFGMVQLSPDTRLDGWDGCGGYHYSDSIIYGFSHTHLSGTGVPDYCDILVMPYSGELQLNNGADGNPGYGSHFIHSSESASPGYYKVFLNDCQVTAELTATTRAGFHAYSFQKGSTPHILFDLQHRDKVTGSWIRIINDSTILGYRASTGWARDQRVYFAARFSKPFIKYGIAENDILLNEVSYADGTGLKAWFDFDQNGANQILVKVGISANSAEYALANVDAEIKGWDFKQIKEQTYNSWNTELGKIRIEGSTKDRKTIFYTALYHTMICPNTYNDTDGSYLGSDFKTHKTSEGNYYTVFSLWDTYRALHPLLSIIDQRRTSEFISTFLHQFTDGGMLPVWELAANETWCMIGYHSIPVITDAWVKGIRNFDADKTLKAMVHSANRDIFGLQYYKKYGFIPASKEHESVSKTLEYAYDDWCIAVLADSLKNDSISSQFYLRAQSYKHLFDASNGFMNARYNGGFYAPFKPEEVNFNYTEANAWQYSFSAPQDMNHFMQLHGGKKGAAAFLDRLFSASSETSGRDQSDITGMIGQYAQGNEPSHHIAYLYNYCGEPYKTAEIVSRIQHDFYVNSPDGLIGNEDCGQMSAWHVFSSLGFYPACPGTDEYLFGTPAFESSTIHLENGNDFRINAHNISATAIYIESARLNGKPLMKSYLKHSEIMKGGTLDLYMNDKPGSEFGIDEVNCPVTVIAGPQVLPAPLASPNEMVFSDSISLSLKATDGALITYTTDGSEPTINSKTYTSPIVIKQSTSIRYNAWKDGFVSPPAQQSDYERMPVGISIVSLSDFAHQYSGSGRNNLIDGLKGSGDFRLGGWQGFDGKDVEVTLENHKTEPIKGVSVGCFQDINAWIFYPAEVQLFTSDNGTDFTYIQSVKNDFPDNTWGSFQKTFKFNGLNIRNKFIKVILRNHGPIPAWHPGAGNPTWIFSDEISIIR